MPVELPVGEIVAAKMAAELQAQAPRPPGPEALLGVYHALEQAGRAAEDQQARAWDPAAATIANFRMLKASLLGWGKPAARANRVQAMPSRAVKSREKVPNRAAAA